MNMKMKRGAPVEWVEEGAGSRKNCEQRSSRGKYCGRELEYVRRCLDSEDLANKTRPWTERLEAGFSQLIGARYAIAHNSGTSALHSCLAAAGVGPGDEVISPALTVVMDSFATLHLGATPVFADVDRETHNVRPEDVAQKITARTKAIITVSLQGLPADVAPMMRLAADRNVIVVEDCAQAMLARYDCTQPCPGCPGRCAAKYSGTVGHLGVFSFETKKHLSTGEGGMVVTDDERLAERVRKFGGIGYKNLTAAAGRMTILPDEFQDPHYERFDTVGLNYRMPEICAAIGLAQVERAHDLVGRRRAIARMFDEAVAECAWLVPQRVPPGLENTYYTYAVRYEGDRVHGVSWREFWRRYKAIGGDGFYGACRVPYLEPVYRGLTRGGRTFNAGTCPVAEALQPQLMQFKTNYRDLDDAQHKVDILRRLIDELGR